MAVLDVRPPGANDEEEFEELSRFVESQRLRYRRLVAALVGGGIALCTLGGALLWAGKGGVAGGFALALGGLALGRGLLSALTDIDTRDRGEFDALRRELERDIAEKTGGVS